MKQIPDTINGIKVTKEEKEILQLYLEHSVIYGYKYGSHPTTDCILRVKLVPLEEKGLIFLGADLADSEGVVSTSILKPDICELLENLPEL